MFGRRSGILEYAKWDVWGMGRDVERMELSVMCFPSGFVKEAFVDGRKLSVFCFLVTWTFLEDYYVGVAVKVFLYLYRN